ncbi:MAG: 2,3-bisphosphoglycerate-independent phosphoglycerate mutase [Candidatus Cloacimonetes bacterium]|nr:2,3-bisphosphoglycerate-independent phosphoglycerate mutase [Candidatus Cloacimonadota bacterium]MCF7813927.1 2,3-bisphosphoglycerate-independent phosphoglycerate mutase [Candidatus Cloacimonadota bacterium]MCF7868021.1 2,3-bisphosphoglycerate-independent phosphoglycerate mutase [Candidatus Cloacimonadota bacterium]MCF7884771.1 2,3-bisphosphoglycerate-independent phosphoglycerate mutase [Candidatus Cloacimonadota bacterium]
MNKALLLILDGFGINESDYGNAIKAAKTPNYDTFYAENPHSQLNASGLNVGLLKGDMGNSEVGHLNIGAGRVVYQLNSLIMKSIEDGDFYQNSVLLSAIEQAKKNTSKLHLMGLLSDGNVHTNIDHLWALLKLCKQEGMDQVYYHAFMDGRDTLPHSGIDFMQQFLEKSTEIGIGRIATISGRYYAMDRDNRWDRIEKAYDAIVNGKGEEYSDPIEAIQGSYDEEITDEFIIPKVMIENGEPVARIEENDAVIAFNFRADRMRQITRALKIPDFDKFERTEFNNLKFVSISEYDIEFNDYIDVAYHLKKMDNILGKIISVKGLNQLRLAETEKYAHVTFFFNGGVEKPFPKEDRILVNSPQVATYDLQPEMSAYEVCDKLIDAIRSEKYDLIITNFANCDMVGHTGVFEAAVKAVETVDKCLNKIIPAARENGFNILLTADHGNAEKMLDEEGRIFTAHSKNPVPFVVHSQKKKIEKIQNGILADIAPTILNLMEIEKPKEMTGNSLIE